MKLSYQSGDKPLWSQLYDILEGRILNGEYQAGEILPSEMSIMEEFDVSRITVRQAMNKLIQAKMITRKRGKGTIVLERDNHVATSFQSSFHGVEEKNSTNDRRVINVKYEKPPLDVAYFFDIPVEKKVLKLTRQIFINEQPVTHFETYLNPVVPLTDQHDFSGSLYKELEQAGFPVTEVKEKITASIINDKEKELFHIHKNEAIMHRIRMGKSHNTPVEYTYSQYIANGYELSIHLK